MKNQKIIACLYALFYLIIFLPTEKFEIPNVLGIYGTISALFYGPVPTNIIFWAFSSLLGLLLVFFKNPILATIGYLLTYIYLFQQLKFEKATSSILFIVTFGIFLLITLYSIYLRIRTFESKIS